MKFDPYHHGSLKDDLIEKGLILLNSDGVENFSLRKVASMCGVSHNAPYKHFKDKDELIQAITYIVMNGFLDSLSASSEKYKNNPKEQLLHIGLDYVTFIINNPQFQSFIFSGGLDFSIELKDDDIFYRSNILFDIFKNCVDGYFKTIYPNKSNFSNELLSLWSQIHGLSILLVNKSIVLDDSSYYNQIYRILDLNLSYYEKSSPY